MALLLNVSLCAHGGHEHAASPYLGDYEATGTHEVAGTMMEVQVLTNGTRTIVANGIPDHKTATYRNRIQPQRYVFKLPMKPIAKETPTPYNVPQPFGITLQGVMIDPFAAEWYQRDRRSGWQYHALQYLHDFDDNNAHVQPTGKYHYHGVPEALITTKEKPVLIGFAGDGFPIYGPYGYKNPTDSESAVIELNSSWVLREGERPGGPGGRYDGTFVEDYEFVEGKGDLDECNGRFGVTPEFPEGTYYYVLTRQWPYVGRAFRGELAESFKVRPRGGDRRRPGRELR